MFNLVKYYEEMFLVPEVLRKKKVGRCLYELIRSSENLSSKIFLWC